jgi:sugar phosphate isomerase/epimerase
MPELAVSTWSLHRALGATYPGLDAAGPRPAQPTYGPGSLTLLDAPAAVAALGIPNLEVCHFHFPRTDAEFLAAFRQRLAEAGVRLLTLLVDAGDITAPDPAARAADLQRIRGWIDVAAAVGARRVRIIAGDASPSEGEEAVRTSTAGLSELAAYARERGVQAVTENWHALAMDPAALLAILDGAQGAVGLCADFGNFPAAERHAKLQAILPRASSIHAKAEFSAGGEMDEEGFRGCLNLARQAGFSGAYVLIFEGPGDEAAGLAQMASVVRSYL